MKKNLIAVAGALLLAGAMTMPVNMESKPSPRPVAAAAGVPSGQQRMGGMRHPEIHRALRALQNAQAALSSAAHDYHGHREKALKLTNDAIKECEAALASAEK